MKNIDKDLLDKAQKAKSKEEALEILKQGGIELTDEDLKDISGGEGDNHFCWWLFIPPLRTDEDGHRCTVFIMPTPDSECPNEDEPAQPAEQC